VRTIAGKRLADDQTNRRWEITGNQKAIVVEVDEEGDFKLNYEGEVSGWMYRKHFEYVVEKHNDSDSTDTGSVSSRHTSSDNDSDPSSPSSQSNESARVEDDVSVIAFFAAQHAAKELDMCLRRSWTSQLVHGPTAGRQENITPLAHNDVPPEAEADRPTTGIAPPPGLPSPQTTGSGDLLSVGSVLHGQGTCQPCAWFWKPQGCQNGYNCNRCHLCPDGTLKARKRCKRDILRAMEHLAGAGVSGI